MLPHLLMKFVLTLGLVALPSASALAETDSQSANEEVEASMTSGEVAISSKIRSKVAAGSPMPLAVLITNVGEAPITVSSSGRLVNVSYRVFDAAGRAVPRTRWGKMWLHYEGDPLRRRFRFVTSELASGEELLVNENLGRYVDLSIAGKYTVEVSWFSQESDDEAGKLKNSIQTTIKFEVVEPGGLETRRVRWVEESAAQPTTPAEQRDGM